MRDDIIWLGSEWKDIPIVCGSLGGREAERETPSRELRRTKEGSIGASSLPKSGRYLQERERGTVTRSVI